MAKPGVLVPSDFSFDIKVMDYASGESEIVITGAAATAALFTEEAGGGQFGGRDGRAVTLKTQCRIPITIESTEGDVIAQIMLTAVKRAAESGTINASVPPSLFGTATFPAPMVIKSGPEYTAVDLDTFSTEILEAMVKSTGRSKGGVIKQALRKMAHEGYNQGLLDQDIGDKLQAEYEAERRGDQ